MKKKVISILLVLALCAAVLPTFAAAEDAAVKEVATEAALREAITAGGSIKMTADIKISSQLTIENVDVTLDLNGHVLSASGSSCVFHLTKSDAKLTLKDSNPNTPHYFARNTDGLWVWNNDEATTDYVVNGGIITGGGGTNGGGIYVNYGTLVMDGGNIVGCESKSNHSSGGGVTVGIGGGSPANFTMNAGNIIGCVAAFDSRNDGLDGGGVHVVNGSTFTMNGGTIRECHAANQGDAIYNLGTMYADGGTVDGTVANSGTITCSSDAKSQTTFLQIVNNYTTDETGDSYGTINGGVFYGVIKNKTSTTASDPQNHTSKITGGVFFADTHVNWIDGVQYVYGTEHDVCFIEGNDDDGHEIFRAGWVIGNNTKLVRHKDEPKKDGYTLVWYNGDTPWDFNDVVTSGLVLTAQWEPNEYTVTFNSNGGSDVSSATVAHGKTLTAPDDPTNEGYVFAGWFKDADCKDDWKFETDTVTDDITLYAKWDKEPEKEPEKDPEEEEKPNTDGLGGLIAILDDVPFVDVSANHYFYDAVKWAYHSGVTGGTDAWHFSPDAGCTRAQIVTFLWRAAGCPSATYLGNFKDVDADSYYATAVAWAVANGITNGTSATTFSPEAVCTRADAVTFLYRAFGKNPNYTKNFSDVPANAYFADAVAWAAENGVTGGTGSGKFSPADTCSRAQIVTFLYRTLG